LPAATAACVSLLQNHNVKERPFEDVSSNPPTRSRSPTRAGRNRLGPGGRRGFYARALCLSTTFSRKIRISQHLEKTLKKQRDFAAPQLPRGPRERFGVATKLIYRFA
jgi:hypothetical protein